MDKRYISLKELSQYTGICRRTLYAWTFAHKIPYFKLNGKLIRFDLREVEEWLNSQKVGIGVGLY